MQRQLLLKRASVQHENVNKVANEQNRKVNPVKRRNSASAEPSKGHKAKSAVESQMKRQDEKETKVKKGIFKTFFTKLSKGEQISRNKLSTKAIKLPKNFASLVMDLEIKVDSGVTDMQSVDKLLQLYSVS